MAARSLLLKEDLAAARACLAGARFPDVADQRRALSNWLDRHLRARLAACGDFEALKPTLIGSWARGELCPNSDVDVIFSGPEGAVAEFTARAFAAGIKLRARVPADPADWGVGVEPFDRLALADVGARPVSRGERQDILRAARRERDERRRRQDAVTNYLEPNLKFGAGGLRDIGQALSLAKLYAERFVDADPYPFELLAKLKDEFLFLRQHLHLAGAGDTLTAADQLQLAPTLGLEPRELMREVQSELERASFYADWIVAACTGSPPTKDGPKRSAAEVLSALAADPGPRTQFDVRRGGRAAFKALDALKRGALLKSALGKPVDDALIVALHRSRVLEQFLPELKKIRGLVSHDHYHRYTADAHLVQTLRETQRVEDRARELGPLAARAREFTMKEWWTLKLAALFHDLAKGGGEDHATAGSALAERRLAEWGYPQGIRADVTWLVRHHLALSHAAFRQNPASRATWRALFELGLKGRRLDLLAVFTAIDIRATNPEAWTPWKAQLLAELAENLASPRAVRLRKYLSAAPDLEALLLKIDPAVLEALSPELLARDLRLVRGGEAPVLVTRVKGRLWVRFHRAHDKPGLFFDFVKHLFGFGLSVQMCFAHTLEGVGVYDWFMIKGERAPRQVSGWLNLPAQGEVVVPPVTFQTVELTARGEDEWVFSLRGRDQRGLLVNAARAMSEAGLSISWARVHTWGQQVDDVFGVRAPDPSTKVSLVGIFSLAHPTKIGRL